MSNSRKICFYIFLTITILLNAFIIVESCIAGAGSSQQSQGFTQAIIDFVKMIDPSSPIGNDPGAVHAVVRKVFGHFLLFGLSGIFAALTLEMADFKENKREMKIIVIGLSFGLFVSLLTETIQYFIPGRAGVFTDVLIDFGGFLFFGFITYIIFFIVNKKNKTKLKRAV